MNLLEIVSEMVEGYISGGAEEAVAEGVEETAEEATGRDLYRQLSNRRVNRVPCRRTGYEYELIDLLEATVTGTVPVSLRMATCS